MNRRLLFVLLAIASLVATSPLRADEKSYSYARIVRLSFVSGDVQIARSSSDDWEMAVANMPIQQGFAIGTNNGRAEVEFESGATLWIAENSVVQFTELALSDGGRINKLTLSQGTASLDAHVRQTDTFQISTPNFSVSIPKHAKLRIEAWHDGGALNVFDGNASVESASGSKDVGNGQTFAIGGPNSVAGANVDSSSAAIKPNPRRDSWDEWVNGRDSAIESGAGQTAQYTNSPVDYGYSDLSSYGSWLSCPGYGLGWQPFGVSSGFTPFYNGYWDTYQGLGWTWVSYEPWGWMPYHFGGWNYASGCGGWTWFPGNYGFFSPAPVQFCRTGGRACWQPTTRPLPIRGPAVTMLGTPRRTEPEPGKPFAEAPVVIGGKGKIGDESSLEVWKPGQPGGEFEPLAGPMKNGKLLTAEESERVGIKPPLAVPTAGSLAELHGVAFDASQNRYINAGGDTAHAGGSGASSRLNARPILANGVREPKGTPRAPEPNPYAASEASSHARPGESAFGGNDLHNSGFHPTPGLSPSRGGGGTEGSSGWFGGSGSHGASSGGSHSNSAPASSGGSHH